MTGAGRESAPVSFTRRVSHYHARKVIRTRRKTISHDSKTTDWREEYAYTLGVQAYVFGVPWVVLTQLRYSWVVGQRLMQAASDIFLGWYKSSFSGNQYYWRQLKDKKGSFDMQKLDERGLATYLAVCSACLARAHARAGDAAAMSGYMGSGSVFDKAISNFSVAYADQTERDYQALADAVKKGQIVAETGI